MTQLSPGTGERNAATGRFQQGPLNFRHYPPSQPQIQICSVRVNNCTNIGTGCAKTWSSRSSAERCGARYRVLRSGGRDPRRPRSPRVTCGPEFRPTRLESAPGRGIPPPIAAPLPDSGVGLASRFKSAACGSGQVSPAGSGPVSAAGAADPPPSAGSADPPAAQQTDASSSSQIC